MTTTTRKQKRELDLYNEAEALVDPVAARVRDLNAQHRITDAAAKEAIAVNQAAYSAVQDAVVVLRALVAALSDSAGHDRTFNLAECVTRARELIGA